MVADWTKIVEDNNSIKSETLMWKTFKVIDADAYMY